MKEIDKKLIDTINRYTPSGIHCMSFSSFVLSLSPIITCYYEICRKTLGVIGCIAGF